MGQILQDGENAESDPYGDCKTFRFDLNDGLNFGIFGWKR